MDTRQLDKILRHTLDDFRLSRGERRMLSTTLEQLGAGEAQLALLRSRAFDIAREQINNGDDGGREDREQTIAVIEWLEEVVKVMQPARPRGEIADEVYFCPGNDCSRKIIELIHLARHKLDICVFTITDDSISDAIVDSHAGGTVVRIISDNDKSLDGGSDISRFERLGIPVRLDLTEHHMHHKFAVFDDTFSLTGSYNWTRSAAKYNMENFIVTHDEHTTRQFGQLFERLWKELERHG
ncbi:MAG: hypothetical protein JXM70_17935 [Pirellulales bacterium]|nr:hypothetical protein [Pirellulales bacterium]